MVFSRSSWRFLAVLAVLCVLPLGLGCGGNKTTETASAPTSVTVSGTVTYIRKPLLVDATTGIPTGLLETETATDKFKTLPLRGVAVRIYQGTAETDVSGNPVTVWKVVGSVTTDTDGKYTSTVPIDKQTFVEIVSSMSPVAGSSVRLVAASVSDTTPVGDRPFYALRKNAGGSTPAGDPTPGSTLGADATVDFAIDVAMPWWKARLAHTITKTTTTVGGSSVITWVPESVLETTASGSRVAAILDNAYTFGSTLGDPTPGYNLYLHYDAASTDLQPSFITYDRTVFPHAFDGSSFAYFGFIRSASSNDDAWDEGVLFPLFARNWMISQRFTSLLPTAPLEDRSDLQDLRPNMALLEGYSQAIAAVMLKSPYLADTSAGSVVYRDVRATSGLGTDAYSAANISAIAWKLNLHANGTLAGSVVTPKLDTPTGWATLTQTAISRFFTIVLPKDTATATYATDIASIYGQLARLKETKAASDAVDLAAFFPDATLTSLVGPGITWPRPTTLPDPFVSSEAGFVADWGANPNSLTKALPSFTLSMANAHRNSLNQFPNFSKGEVFAARFTLSGDRIYKLSVSTVPVIPATAQVQVTLGGKDYLFSAGTEPIRLPALVGNSTTVVHQSVQVRLLSSDIQQPDLVVTVQLDQQAP